MKFDWLFMAKFLHLSNRIFHDATFFPLFLLFFKMVIVMR